MNRKELIKLIEENPDLDIKFMVSCDDVIDEYSYMLLNNFHCEVDTIYESDERVYIGEQEAIENLSDYYSDCEEYKDLSDQGYEIVIRNKVNELKHYEAIIVWVNNH